MSEYSTVRRGGEMEQLEHAGSNPVATSISLSVRRAEEVVYCLYTHNMQVYVSLLGPIQPILKVLIIHYISF